MSFSLRFLPDNRSWSADEPVDLVLAAAGCDILLEQPCGSRTVCGKCRVRVVEGDVPAGAEDLRLLGQAAVAEGWRLACRMTLAAPATIEVPPALRSTAAKSFGDDTLFTLPLDPPVRGVRVRIPEAQEVAHEAGAGPHHPPPGALERLALALRAAAGRPRTNGKSAPVQPDVALGTLAPGAAALRELAAALRHGPEVRAWLDADGRLLAVEPAGGETGAGPDCGLALDVGTTTVAVALVELARGEVLASASGLNAQTPFGADVISRIAHAQERADGAGADALHRALVRGLDGLIARCLESAAVPAARVRALAAVGNPTMLHTLLGADPTSLGQAPYVGAWRGSWHGLAGELGLELPRGASAYLAPGVGSHVGADTIAAIVACGLDQAERPTLLVDLGTNSEVVLGCRDFILCASTSAGPAFEGATIRQGMRAAPGAIEQVRIRQSGSVMLRVVGGEEPVGLCGSGLVDAAAALLGAGVIEPSGRMRSREELEALVPPALAQRLLEDPEAGAGRAFLLGGVAGRQVLLTAADVRQLQLVKGSIAAGIRVLLARKALRLDDVAGVLLAGAFGNYLRKTSAQAIGLVPDIDPERVHFVGNAAGAGARAVLCDRGLRRRAEEAAARAEYVELADAPEYPDLFAAELAFPAPASTG